MGELIGTRRLLFKEIAALDTSIKRLASQPLIAVRKVFETICTVPITVLDSLQSSSGTKFETERDRKDAEDMFFA